MGDEDLEDLVAEFLDQRGLEPGLGAEAFAAARAPRERELLAAIRAAEQAENLLTSSAPERPERIGPYRVEALLGRGGMGVVYAVEREGRRFALKLLAPGLAAPRALERFQREARSLARMTHPGIVRVHDTGLFQGAPYLVMERLEGPTLAELALPLEPERAARIVRDLALAVEAAHAAGVLHRDIKPTNVILRGGTEPVLLDFGLVAAEDEDTLTTSGALLGTPRYMAPEQAAGLPVGRRTDVHALGLILFELLYGQPARPEGSREEVLARVLRGSVHRVRCGKAPRGLESVMWSALAREPRRRPASAAALAEELTRFLSGEPVRVHGPRVHQRLVDGLRRRPRSALGGVLGLVALALLGRILVRAPLHTREARDAYLDAGLCAWMQGSESLARVELERAHAIDPEDGRAAALSAALWGGATVPRQPAWIAEGLVLLRAGEARRAVPELAAAAPGSALPAALLVRALQQAGESERALEEARASRARFPRSSALLAELARQLEERGDGAQALALLREAGGPEQAPLLAARARLALATGADDEAVEIGLRAAERFDASGGDATVELPRLLSLAQVSATTILALERRRAAGDERALVSFALAYALDSEHRIVEAAAAYADALVRDPELVRAHLNLAHLHAGAQLGACLACDRAYAEAPAMLSPERALHNLRAALYLDRGEGDACIGPAIQTTLTVGARAPESGAREAIEAVLSELVQRPGLSAGGRRRLEDGLARLRGAAGK